MTDTPHPWLGRDYQDLLQGLAQGQHRFTISVTRPSGFSYGAGRLRVVGVRVTEGNGDSKTHCVLAYERYLIPESKRREPRRGGRRGDQKGS